MTPNSPRPTVKALIQNGSPKNDNSQAMIKALLTTGNKIATAKCLQNIIPKQAMSVAAVPNKTSNDAVGEKQLANKQPRVKTFACFLLKKHKSTKISEKRN